MTLSLEGDLAGVVSASGTRVKVGFGVADFLAVDGFEEGGWFSISDWGDWDFISCLGGGVIDIAAAG